MTRYTAFYDSVIGKLKIAGTDAGILTLSFIETDTALSDTLSDCLRECIEQVDEYFRGTRKSFSVPLLPQGTEFQQQVWQQLIRIPFGKTTTYQQIAAALGNPKASQAVGRANGVNPIAILIPCHRVIGIDGKLTGYGGGLWRKEWLLRHEGALIV